MKYIPNTIHSSSIYSYPFEMHNDTGHVIRAYTQLIDAIWTHLMKHLFYDIS